MVMKMTIFVISQGGGGIRKLRTYTVAEVMTAIHMYARNDINKIEQVLKCRVSLMITDYQRTHGGLLHISQQKHALCNVRLWYHLSTICPYSVNIGRSR